jgi:hypothetical protein
VKPAQGWGTHSLVAKKVWATRLCRVHHEANNDRDHFVVGYAILQTPM